jgi:hypothetical protein
MPICTVYDNRTGTSPLTLQLSSILKSFYFSVTLGGYYILLDSVKKMLVSDD